MPLVRMQGICKQFPGVTALDCVDFEVEASEVVALIGENGAGKSTLMKILGGMLSSDRGEIQVDAALAGGIGFIHQELRLLDNLDIAGNIFLGREKTWGGPLRLIDRAAIEAETSKQLARVGFDVSPRTLVRDLSLAQQQLVEIAKALSLDARLLIMDEPTSCLTNVEVERLFQVIADLKQRGVSVIYISHRLQEIERIADRVVALRDGRNAGALKRSEINHDNMVRMMVGRELKDLFAATNANRAATGAQCAIEVRNFRTRRYPNTQVSFSVQRGEIFGIAGLVGSGRTELARALFGAENALSGSVSIAGKIVRISAARDAIDAGLFLAPEDRRTAGLILPMTIRENVTLPGLRSWFIQRERERETATQVSARLQIKAPSIETTVATLSGGNQQKVVLAKWLALEPRVIVFDEPTRGIDVGAKAEVYRLMRELADKGVAIIMISSEMEEILGNSDRVAVMHEGRISGVLDRAECTQEAIMRLAVA